MLLFFDLLMLVTVIVMASLIFIYYHKKYDKVNLFKLFFYGMLMTIPVIFFQKVLLFFDAFPIMFSKLYIALIVIGFTEEFFKRFIVTSFAYKNKHYKNRFDGIIYAVITALGFALFEQLLYILIEFQSYKVNFSRGLVTIPSHLLFSITMGYYLSMAKFSVRNRKKQYYFMLSLLVPFLFHGIFNYLIFVEAFILLPIFILFILFLYVVNINKLHDFYIEKSEFE